MRDGGVAKQREQGTGTRKRPPRHFAPPLSRAPQKLKIFVGGFQEGNYYLCSLRSQVYDLDPAVQPRDDREFLIFLKLKNFCHSRDGGNRVYKIREQFFKFNRPTPAYAGVTRVLYFLENKARWKFPSGGGVPAGRGGL